MRGKRLDRQTLTIGGVVLAVLVIATLIFGDDIGLYGTTSEEETPAPEVCPDGSAKDGVGDPCNHDEDGDGVPDDQDQCPSEAGTANGCPDNDGDGVPNSGDACPDSPNDAVGDACNHDEDADGVPDDQDQCPTEAGTAAGCPDNDGDGVANKDDACPDSPNDAVGDACNHDEDADGVPDDQDSCPTEAGTAAGCPDNDGDGVANSGDTCPDYANDAVGDPCNPDEDGDGVLDAADACPTEAASTASGCPEVALVPTEEVTPLPTEEAALPTEEAAPQATQEVTPEATQEAAPLATEEPTVQAAVTAGFGAYIAADGTVQFTDTSTTTGGAQIASWEWTFDDGQSSTEQNPTHRYAAPGTYQVRLVVTATDGTTSTATGAVSITESQADPMRCAFHMELQNDRVPLTVNFVNDSTNVTSFEWVFGDGTANSTETNPVHIYEAVGTYNIALTCTGALGTLNATGRVTASETSAETGLIAQFSGNPGRGVAPLTVSFTDRSQGSIVSWAWEFGDGGTSTDQNPTHEYTAVGNYNVSLTVTDANGSTATATGQIGVITQPTAPTVDFSVTPREGEPPLNVTVTDITVGTITSWTWNFGDGSADVTGQGPHQHSYTTAGTYTITLNATGPDGGGSAFKQVVVLPPGTIVDAAFTYRFNGAVPGGFEECFTDQSVGTVASYLWDFGDGGTSTEQSPCHVYAAEAQYSVTLSVTGTSGETSTATRLVPVQTGNEAPIASFTKNKTTAQVDQSISFTDTSTGIITTWAWNFGDGGTSTSRNPSHKYTATGTYTITLTVTGPGGSSQAQSQTVTITEKTTSTSFSCGFSGTTNPLDGQSVVYTVNNPSATTGYTYKWTVDGADYGTERSITVTWVAGNHTIVLVVTRGSDSVICTKSSSIVAAMLHVRFDASKSTIGIGQEVCFTDRSTSTGTLVSWLWDFGDGTTSTEQNPCHAYETTGSKAVRLTVTDSNGKSGTAKKTISVVESQTLAADANPESGIAPLKVTFTPIYTGLYNNKFDWIFPDGSHAYMESPSYVFQTPGEYVVKVKGSGPLGTLEATVTVIVAAETDVRAAFTPNPWGGIAPKEICFTDRSVSEASQIVSWEWTFGDGATSTDQNPCHLFEQVGNYNVTLKVTTAATLSATASNLIHLYPATGGSASFGVELKPDREVCFTSYLGEGLEVVSWDFGDGTTSTEANPCVKYSANGIYNVTLSYTGVEIPGTVSRQIQVTTVTSSELPTLVVNSECLTDGQARFTISNTGGAMANADTYSVTDEDGNVLDSGTFQLAKNGSKVITVTGNGTLTLTTVDTRLSESTECKPPLLGCQKNNPDRLDCSSLKVEGQCDNNQAVFVITNTGDAGDGDMRAATQWHLFQDGTEIDNGPIQLKGGETMTLTFDWAGNLKLVADQQVGHPGSSVPQTSLSCRAAEPELEVGGQCLVATGQVSFTLTNTGAAMPAGAEYTITSGGAILGSGTTNALGKNESQTFTVAAPADGQTVTFNAAGLTSPAEVTNCFALPELSVAGQCAADTGDVIFTLTNSGGPMAAGVDYTISDSTGTQLDAGTTNVLGAGESQTFTVPASTSGGTITFSAAGLAAPARVENCFALPNLSVAGQCAADTGDVIFTLTNSGGPMTAGVEYSIESDGATLGSGTTNVLGAGESQSFTVAAPASGQPVTFETAGIVTTATVESCFALPKLSVAGQCAADTAQVIFTLTNNGGPMSGAVDYTISDSTGTLDQGQTNVLGAGESQDFTVPASVSGGTITFSAAGLTTPATVTNCFALPKLSAAGQCAADTGEVIFTLTNSGGPMTADVAYSISDNAGVIAAGTTNVLGTGESQTFTVPAPTTGETITFTAAGLTTPATTENCFALPKLTLGGQCNPPDGTVSFILTNSGGPMSAGADYTISDSSGAELDKGTTNVLGAGESQTFSVPATNEGLKISMQVAGVTETAGVENCFAKADLAAAGQCDVAAGNVNFTFYNVGGPMDAGADYTITDSSGAELDKGTTNVLGAGESQTFTVPAKTSGETITFSAAGLSAPASVANCFALPKLSAAGQCAADTGEVIFTLTNSGGPMTAGVAYSISDSAGVIAAGTTNVLGAGESQTFTVPAPTTGETITFTAAGLDAPATTENCFALPKLSAAGQCSVDAGEVVFTLTNSGGPMTAAADYTITDSSGAELDKGMTNVLGAGESQTFTVPARTDGGTITFNAAGLTAAASVDNCFALPKLSLSGQCVTDTGEVVFTLTNSGGPMNAGVEYTIRSEVGVMTSFTKALGAGESQFFTVAAPVNGSAVVMEVAGLAESASITDCFALPKLMAVGLCSVDTGEVFFAVTNVGGPMTAPENYTIINANEETLAEGQTNVLGTGESQSFTVPARPDGGTIYFNIANLNVSAAVDQCFALPKLVFNGECVENGKATFTIINTGGPMSAPEDYQVVDENGTVLDQDQYQLGAGETMQINVEGYYGVITLTAPGGITVDTYCQQPDTTPTPEPTVEPTQEPTEVAEVPQCGLTSYMGSNGFPVVDMNPALCTGEVLSGPWTPIEIGGAVCPDWLVYHTNQTGDWEIFRLGKIPGDPEANVNLSQGVGQGVSDVAPSRSPDSAWIAFASNRDGNWEIYVGRTDGSEQQRVTYAVDAIDVDPVWSPVGNYIVYESARDGNWELYMVDVATGAETRLTDNPANDINAFWSPDGTKLLFQSDRDDLWQIYELNISTLEVTKLSDGSGDDHEPMYSHDGKLILFNSHRDEGDNSVVYVMNADGTEIKRVSDPAGDATLQVWSDDDALIAYQSNLDGDLDIYVYEVATEQTRLVTDNDIADYAPTWYCDGHTVVFTSDILKADEFSPDSNIFSTPADPITAPAIKVEDEAAQLTDSPDADQYPQDSPAEENASRERRLPSPEDHRKL